MFNLGGFCCVMFNLGGYAAYRMPFHVLFWGVVNDMWFVCFATAVQFCLI